MKLTKLIWIFFLSTLLPHLIKSQTFEAGYVFLNSGDSIQGQIQVTNSKRNSEYCKFRTVGDQTSATYLPTDIKGYKYLNGEYFVSKQVKIDADTVGLFLEYLSGGEVDFYFYFDQSGEHYLVDAGDGELRELIYQVPETLSSGETYMKESNRYIGQLKVSMQDAPEIFNVIERIRLNKKSLNQLNEKYHQTAHPEGDYRSYEALNSPDLIEVGFFMAASTLQLNTSKSFPAWGPNYVRDANFQRAYYPSLGIYFNLTLPYLNEKINFEFGSSISQINLESESLTDDGNNSSITHLHIMKIDQVTLDNYLMLKYKFTLSKRVHPLISFGGFWSPVVSSDYYRSYTIYSAQNEEAHFEEHKDASSVKFDSGFSVGVGTQYFLKNGRKMHLDLIYKKGFNYLNESWPGTRLLDSKYFGVKVGITVLK